MSEHPGQSDITFCIDVGNDGSSHVSVIKGKYFKCSDKYFFRPTERLLLLM